jgi:hypothetical protein
LEQSGASARRRDEETAMSWRPVTAILAAALMSAGLTFLGCSKEPTAETPRIEEKTFAFKPAAVAVRVGVLAGELTDLSVVQRVNAATGEVVYAPQLRGNLKLKNTSPDEALRLLNGHVEYLDASGASIALPPDRADTTFRFYAYATERLDPGAEITHRVDVPFPAAALNGKTLRELRLSVTYLPAPYRQESVELPVALAAG